MSNPISMSGYTKLFNSILASTIWREDDKTRIVWITMLAMSNKDGLVEGSIPGLADMARVSIDDCKFALDKLSSPDEYSRTKAFDGRRIKQVQAGWLILNHAIYRSKMSADERREYNRIKQAEWRQKMSTGVNDIPCLLPLSAHTDTDTDTKANTNPPAMDGFGRFWKAYPKKVSKIDAIKAFSKIDPSESVLMKMLSALEVHKKSQQWAKDNGQFIPHPAKWLNGAKWLDEITPSPGEPRPRDPNIYLYGQLRLTKDNPPKRDQFANESAFLSCQAGYEAHFRKVRA